MLAFVAANGFLRLAFIGQLGEDYFHFIWWRAVMLQSPQHV